MQEITARELQKKLEQKEDCLLLDVREVEEYADGTIEPSLKIPMNSVPDCLDQLDSARKIVVYCHGGVRSARVVAYLEEHGFGDVWNLQGGILAWQELVS